MHTHTGRANAVPGLRNIDANPGTGTALASMVLNPGPHPGTTIALTGGVRVCVCIWT